MRNVMQKYTEQGLPKVASVLLQCPTVTLTASETGELNKGLATVDCRYVRRGRRPKYSLIKQINSLHRQEEKNASEIQQSSTVTLTASEK